MKKSILLIGMLVLIGKSYAQTDFEGEMKKTLIQLDSALDSREMKAIADKFDRIAIAEPDQWLPNYYSAMINCIIAFRTRDPESIEDLTDYAMEKTKTAMEIQPDESELYTLQGMIYQAKIMIDPMNYGQKYSSKANGLFEKATKLNPKNPRPYYLKAISIMHTPVEFGGGKKVAQPLFEKSLELFEQFEPESPIYPHWGKEDCITQLNSCKSSE
jgi:hypothetical protein